MRSRLQYFYSIAVFIGVLGTAYLMIHRDTNSRVPLRALQDGYNFRSEAEMSVPPSMKALFQTGDELSDLKEEKKPESIDSRLPSNSKSTKKSSP